MNEETQEPIYDLLDDDIRLTLWPRHARIRLERAAKKNAMSPMQHRAMHRILDRIEEHEDTRVVVLTGTDNVFCGGMDLEKYFFDAYESPPRFRKNLRESHSWMRRYKSFPAVTLAKVNGLCVGGGLLMAALSDLLVTADEASFCLSEVNFGIFPSGGTTWGVANNLGSKQALYYMLTAERFDGPTAVSLGLANRTVPRDQLDAEVDRVVASICNKPLAALQYTKQVYERVRTMTFPDAQQFETAMLFDLSYSTKNEWIEKALAQFRKRTFRPGVEAYDQGEEGSSD
ncbi:MAG: enoyl-CoA hydratase-related protein [Nannocystaceae bacterium]